MGNEKQNLFFKFYFRYVIRHAKNIKPEKYLLFICFVSDAESYVETHLWNQKVV
jgi:hypothetical protein